MQCILRETTPHRIGLFTNLKFCDSCTTCHKQEQSIPNDGLGIPLMIAMLLDLIDRAFDHPAWHGPNLRGSIR